MDITLLRGYVVDDEASKTCFNPCFNGYYTFTQNTQHAYDNGLVFQSLF